MTTRLALRAACALLQGWRPAAGSTAGRALANAAARRALPAGARRHAGWRGLVVAAAADTPSAPVKRTYPYRPTEGGRMVYIQDRHPVSLEPKFAKVESSAAAPDAWSGDLLVLGVFEGAFDTPGGEADKDAKPAIKSAALTALDGGLGGALADIVSTYEFKGKAGSSQTVRCGGGAAAKYVTLVGLGPADKAKVVADWGSSPFQQLGSAAAAAAKAVKAKTAAVALIDSTLSEADAAGAAGKVANGLLNGAYESTRFKSKQPPADSGLQSVELLFGGGGAAAAIQRGTSLAAGALLTRYLVEAPPNVCTPTYLAETAAGIAAAAPGCMSLKVLEKAECEALGMGLFLGVAEASAEPPKFIHLTYKPQGAVKRRVAIVGKGLTFDSGGYNIKAGAGSMIEMMKFDMGGSGATLGAAKAVSLLQPEGVEVHFIIASCENMVDARGLRPGDILVASNGKTVEVNNTDAEGRLTLADAMLYAQEHAGAESIIDIATLTGACMIALGDSICALYAPSDDMAAAITGASKEAGEKVWRMPLEESYMEQLKSSVADMKNTGSRLGGSITAALFLKEFVKTDKVEWAHIDMAGPVWRDKDGGATGFGAQMLAEWAVAQGR